MPTDEKSSFNTNQFIEIVNKKSKEFHKTLVTIQDEINYCTFIEDPEARIKPLQDQKDKLIDLNRKINTFLKYYKKAKKHFDDKKISVETALIDSETLDFQFPLLTNIRDMDYEKNKKKEVNRLFQKIRKTTQQAALASTFTKAFYVYQGISEDEQPNQERIAKNYFWGVPAKENKNNVVYFFEWLSYIMGGFFVIPLKNGLKFIGEILPNYLATYFENRAEDVINKRSVSIISMLDYIISVTAYLIFKPLWLLGRAVFSPITSAIAGAKFGFKLGYAIGNAIGSVLESVLGGIGNALKNATENTVVNAIGNGFIFWGAAVKAFFRVSLSVVGGLVFGLPSLAIGLAAVITTIIAVPPLTIYAIGKIPIIGAQAAAWLTTASETLSGLKLVSNIFDANQKIVTAVVPTIAESARQGAGIMSLAQLTESMKGALGMVTNALYQIYKFYCKKDTPSASFSSLQAPLTVDTDEDITLDKPIPLSHRRIHLDIPLSNPKEKEKEEKRHPPVKTTPKKHHLSPIKIKQAANKISHHQSFDVSPKTLRK